MNTISPARIAGRTDGADHGPYMLTDRAWGLWQLAGSGRGMVDMAAAAYNSDDWHLVATVYHECGHAAAARVFGELSWIKITSPRSGICQRTDDQYWPAERVRTFALAGPVAEHLAKYGLWTPDAHLQDCIHTPSLSTSDRIQAGNFGAADLVACAALARRCWSAIQAEASEVLARELARWGASEC